MAAEDRTFGEFNARDRTQHPPAFAPTYKTSVLRSPRNALISLQNSLSEITAPMFSSDELGELDHDLILNYSKGGLPIGERIIVHGHVLDEFGRGVPNALVEVWQANAAGRYRHSGDRHPAPLDPNFTGFGCTLTDAEGRYRFITIRPGAYPWKNHENAWRPAHIHFSVFGRSVAERLVTQMYFPDDPLFSQDPIFNAVSDPAARQRLVARFAIEHTVPEWALGFTFDIVLGGRDRTPADPRP